MERKLVKLVIAVPALEALGKIVKERGKGKLISDLILKHAEELRKAEQLKPRLEPGVGLLEQLQNRLQILEDRLTALENGSKVNSNNGLIRCDNT